MVQTILRQERLGWEGGGEVEGVGGGTGETGRGDCGLLTVG
jgi:hypothetical protein